MSKHSDKRARMDTDSATRTAGVPNTLRRFGLPIWCPRGTLSRRFPQVATGSAEWPSQRWPERFRRAVQVLQPASAGPDSPPTPIFQDGPGCASRISPRLSPPGPVESHVGFVVIGPKNAQNSRGPMPLGVLRMSFRCERFRGPLPGRRLPGKRTGGELAPLSLSSAADGRSRPTGRCFSCPNLPWRRRSCSTGRHPGCSRSRHRRCCRRRRCRRWWRSANPCA